jgi:hypothetical protein
VREVPLAYPLLRYRLGFAIAAAASSLMGAGCFTDPVNMKPTVSIATPTFFPGGGSAEPFFQGAQLAYTASASDPDGDSVEVQWKLTTTDLTPDGKCRPDFELPQNWPQDGWRTGDPFQVLAKDTMAPFCVWAKAVDGYGAASVDARTGHPTDRAPVAVVAVETTTGSTTFPPKAVVKLSAAGSTDPDVGDHLHFKWTLQSMVTDTATSAMPTTTKLAPCADDPADMAVQCFSSDTPGAYQVAVTVTDDTGLPSVASTVLTIAQGPLPVAAIDIVEPVGPGPFLLGRQVRVSGAHSTFTDGSSGYGWALERDGKALPMTLGPCDGDSTQVTECFVPDVEGNYDVTLTVSNGAGMSAPVTVPFIVAGDQPPCLGNTDPPFTTQKTSATQFTVSEVDDDLDPFPGVSNMSWFVSVNMGAFALMRQDFPRFALDTSPFSPGDDVRVRLEIRDRDTTRSASEFTACTTDVCAAPSLINPVACIQRVTWTVLLP